MASYQLVAIESDHILEHNLYWIRQRIGNQCPCSLVSRDPTSLGQELSSQLRFEHAAAAARAQLVGGLPALSCSNVAILARDNDISDIVLHLSGFSTEFICGKLPCSACPGGAVLTSLRRSSPITMLQSIADDAALWFDQSQSFCILYNSVNTVFFVRFQCGFINNHHQTCNKMKT